MPRRIPIDHSMRDSAGRITAAERERYCYADHYCQRAEMAGLDTSEWYEEAVRQLVDMKDACHGKPTRAIVDRMFSELIEPIELGLAEAGVNPKGLVPQFPHLFDLMLRTWANAGE